MPAVDQALGEKRTLNESQILPGGVFLALRNNMLFVSDTPDNSFDFPAKLPRGAQAPMSKYGLVTILVVRVWSHENRRVLTPLPNAVNKLLESSIILGQTIRDKRIFDSIRINLLNDLSFDRLFGLCCFRRKFVYRGQHILAGTASGVTWDRRPVRLACVGFLDRPENITARHIGTSQKRLRG